MMGDYRFLRAISKHSAPCPDDERIRDGFIEWLAEVDPELPPEALERITDESRIKFPGQKVGQFRDWLTETSYEFFKGGVMWQRHRGSPMGHGNHECKE